MLTIKHVKNFKLEKLQVCGLKQYFGHYISNYRETARKFDSLYYSATRFSYINSRKHVRNKTK